MNFWTNFWLLVPPVLLVVISLIYYFVTGKEAPK